MSWRDSADYEVDGMKAVASGVGRVISRAGIVGDDLVITFDDGALLKIWDNGQSCCESRYLTCDDDLSALTGGKLVAVEVRNAPDVQDGGEVHEVRFVEVTTTAGAATVCTHNEHNGYYGGFSLAALFKAVT
jgi:hypothetical protein